MKVEGSLALIADYCLDNSMEFYELSKPGANYHLSFALDGNNKLVKYGNAHVFLAQLNNISTFGEGFLYSSDGTILVHGLSFRNYELDIGEYISSIDKTHIELEVPDKSRHIEEEAVFIWGHTNFGHWVWTYLTRLAALTEFPQLFDKKFVINGAMPKRYQELLFKFGITDEQIIEIHNDETVTFSKLWVPSVHIYRGHYNDLASYIWPDAVHYLRQKLLGDKSLFELPAAKKGKRIYISRKETEWRRVINEEEVDSYLQAQGFEIVEMHKLSIDEQLECVSDAEIIVVAIGGASVLTMMAPKNCVIIELSCPGILGTWASLAWAHMLGQAYHRITGIPDTTSAELARDYDYIVPKNELEWAVTQAISYNTPSINFSQEQCKTQQHA